MYETDESEEIMIRYKSGYKYQLVESYCVKTPIRPIDTITIDYIILAPSGVISIGKGYAWDGASGPGIDTKNFMRGSLVHDAFYQLFRMKLLDIAWRPTVDLLLQTHCLEDGMCRIRAWWVHRGVRLGGGPSADPRHAKIIYEAP